MTEQETPVQSNGTGGGTRRRRATAMVEMAIVLPLLLTILFAICEFSIALMQWQTLGNAAREGAREGSLFRSTCTSSQADADADTAASDTLLAAGITIPPAVIAVSGTCVIPGSTTVTITSPYDFLFLPNFIATLGPTLNLTSTSVMRNSDLSGTSGSGGGDSGSMGSMGSMGSGSSSD